MRKKVLKVLIAALTAMAMITVMSLSAYASTDPVALAGTVDVVEIMTSAATSLVGELLLIIAGVVAAVVGLFAAKIGIMAGFRFIRRMVSAS